MGSKQHIILLDCDGIAVEDITWLSAKRSVAHVIAVANDHNKLPIVDNHRIGWFVPFFQDSADFFLISELTSLLNMHMVESDVMPLVIIVTRDRPLSKAVQMISQYKNTDSICYESLHQLNSLGG
ncbi:hypothetical protein D1115_06600 [Vibrio alfacsensis]|uniref:Response regulator n=1 Tax=Vibrio alfacsensis TaxID=1074311 RepID=A0ABM6YTH1_9VIBR|nr:hypothetical protein D1115_06600 [Vibrio alfacsensis]